MACMPQNVCAWQNHYAYYSCSVQDSSGVPDGSDWLSCDWFEPGAPVPVRCMRHVGSDHPAVRYMRVRAIGVAPSVPRWVLSVGSNQAGQHAAYWSH